MTTPKRMSELGMEVIILTKTCNDEVDQFELAVLQGKDDRTLEDRYLRATVAFERVLDKKRELAEASRAWAIAQTGRKPPKPKQ